MPEGHVGRPPYTGVNEGDIIIRSRTIKSLLDRYTSICEEDYQSRPFKEYEGREPGTQRGTWREILIEIGLEREVKAIEIGVSFNR